MRNSLLVFLLLFFAGCEKYDGSLSLPPPDDDDTVPPVSVTISGRVTSDGVGLSNVNVAISKEGFYITKTNDGGYFTFVGVGRGNYVVFLTNPNKDLYFFSSTSKTVWVNSSNNIVVNFDGKYIGPTLSPNEPIPQPVANKASISGVVYEDKNGNGWYDAGEPVFRNEIIDLSGRETRSTSTGPDGRYIFTGLEAGKYNVTARVTGKSQAVDVFDVAGSVFFVDFPVVWN